VSALRLALGSRTRRETLSRLATGSPQLSEPVNEEVSRRSDQGSSTRYGVGYARTTGRRDGLRAGGWKFFLRKMGVSNSERTNSKSARWKITSDAAPDRNSAIRVLC